MSRKVSIDIKANGHKYKNYKNLYVGSKIIILLLISKQKLSLQNWCIQNNKVFYKQDNIY